MTDLPPPELLAINGFIVIDDSKVGTKYRMARAMAAGSLKRAFYYATTPSGDSPGALAKACHEFGKDLTLLTTWIDTPNSSPVLRLAQKFGATVINCPTSDYDLVSDRAEKMARENQGEHIDFDNGQAIHVLSEIAKSLNLDPKEVWSASAKGAMARAYQIAWPKAKHHVVAVMDYSKADFGIATVHRTDTAYEEAFTGEIPFPCNRTYEAKAWDVMEKLQKAPKSVFFWNPAGPN